MATRLHFEVLGPIRLIRDGEAQKLGGPVQQRVLALLLTRPNGVISDDRLIHEVWSGEPPDSAAHLIQVYVSKLRDVVASGDGGPQIVREGSGYRLVLDPKDIDSAVFVDAASKGGDLVTADPEQAESLLRGALESWRGRPFGDAADRMPTVRMEADRLEEIALRAREDHISAGMALGRHHDLVPVLGGLVEQFPLREEFWGQYMLALYRCGREAEALRSYSRLRQTLGEELGIEPSAKLQQLEEQILLQDPGLLLVLPDPPSTLPAQLTSFVGRAEQVSDLTDLIARNRLVTLLGVGGIGKTRLAIEAAGAALPEFIHGVWWVDFSPVGSERVAAHIASGLGIGRQPGLSHIQSVVRTLSGRRALLVLDNCEHVVEEVAGAVTDLLRGCADLAVLATSRIALGVAGEVVWSVRTLEQPPAGAPHDPDALLTADAIRLFVERATAAEPTYRLNAANAEAVTTLCARLDGLPLAIEMAAARIAVLAPAQILERLTDRFAFLHGPRHPEVPRHETLQAALDWSYTMLEPGLQAAFDRSSVFVGSFDIGGAEAVMSDEGSEPLATLEALTGLTDASLMIVEGTASDTARYRLLETVKEYASQRLADRGELENTRRRHARHYLEILTAAEGSLMTPEFVGWLERIDNAYDEIRQAMEWSLATGAHDSVLAAAPTLFEYWYHEAKADEAGLWGGHMLELGAAAPSRLLAAAQNSVAFSQTIEGDVASALLHADESIRLYRKAMDPAGLVQALFTRAQVALAVGDFETGFACGQEGLEICSDLDNPWRRALPLTVLAFAELFGTGKLDVARELLLETLQLYRGLGDTTSEVVFALTPLCLVSLIQGNQAAAEGYALDAVAIGGYWEGSAFSSLGDALAARDDWSGARSAYRRGVTRSMDVGLENWFRINVRKLARIAAIHEEHEEAARLWGASLANLPVWSASVGQEEIAEVRTALGDGRFRQLSDEGASWSHAEVIARLSASDVESAEG